MHRGGARAPHAAGRVVTAEHCTARRRDGKRCRSAPVHGAAVCRMHGGAAPQVRAAAAERALDADVRRAIGRLEVAPCDNPLEALAELAGEVLAWKDQLGRLVADLRSVRYDSEGYGEQVRGEVLLFERAMDRCAKVLGLIARLDLDARLSRVSEQQADLVVAAVQAALDTAGVTGDRASEARAVAARHLRAVPDVGVTG
ncbi:HGGxSTG domain-containing protein [Actinomycetospora flava]|uniref:HGGxSTG domain-containing protein n=1 Tax=Actinomycetospora flava TaxID=3129232 RepID=A0ABU8M154_9PSEU